MTTLSIRNSINRSPSRRGLPRKQQFSHIRGISIIRGLFLIAFALACFALAPAAQAVDPPPDGGYPNNNTAEGEDALFSLTTGSSNTAAGDIALYSNTTGSSNTATGASALANNNGDNNTANGALTLVDNTTGNNNTANGVLALYNNDAGNNNTANGLDALYSNTIGSRNVATGASALYSNQTGGDNTATGVNALYYNTGNYNTAHGYQALESNTTGTNNTANGLNALNKNTTGFNNVANGASALYKNTVGSYNIALGYNAGYSLTTGSSNIDIGNSGLAAEASTIRIGSVRTQTNTYIAGINGVAVAGGVGVIVDTNGHLGTTTSSARFKEAIKPMDKASEAILALKPVTFRYKKELDPECIPQFGLVAEEVEKVSPDLVARDDEGKPYTVRYEAVNAMLLNEFIKEHCTVQQLKAGMAKQKATIAHLEATAGQQKDLQTTVAKQQEQIDRLTSALKEQTSQIQKVSAQVEISKFTTGRIRGGGPAPQTAANNQ
jgi:hypothetical protein